MGSPPEDVVLERHPGPRRGSQIAGLEDEQALKILQCLCCFLLSLHREGLEVFPQPVTPSQAGDLNVEEAERHSPHQTTQEFASQQAATGKLWLGAGASGKPSCKNKCQG